MTVCYYYYMTTWQEVPEVRRQNLHRIAAGLSDVTNALSAVDYLLENDIAETDPRWEIYQDYAVITYARPFTKTKGVGRLSAKYERFSDKELQLTHELIMEQRREHIAHNDSRTGKVTIVPAGQQGAPGQPPAQETSFVASRRKISHPLMRKVHSTLKDCQVRLAQNVQDELTDLYGPDVAMPDFRFDLLNNEEDTTRATF